MPRGGNNNQNLIPTTAVSEEEARKRRSNGGKKASENRRKKRALKESLELLLSLKLREGDGINLEEVVSFAETNAKEGLRDEKGYANITVQDAILAAQLQKALKGDVRAFENIAKIIQPTADASTLAEAVGTKIEFADLSGGKSE